MISPREVLTNLKRLFQDTPKSRVAKDSRLSHASQPLQVEGTGCATNRWADGPSEQQLALDLLLNLTKANSAFPGPRKGQGWEDLCAQPLLSLMATKNPALDLGTTLESFPFTSPFC